MTRSATRSYVLLLGLGVAAIAAFALDRFWRERALAGPRINVVVVCNTADLKGPDLEAFALYDKVALSPVARALGLYQNRPPEAVSTYHVAPVSEVSLDDSSVTLHDVPRGPLARVVLTTGETSYYADVADRVLKNNSIYVHLD